MKLNGSSSLSSWTLRSDAQPLVLSLKGQFIQKYNLICVLNTAVLLAYMWFADISSHLAQWIIRTQGNALVYDAQNIRTLSSDIFECLSTSMTVPFNTPHNLFPVFSLKATHWSPPTRYSSCPCAGGTNCSQQGFTTSPSNLVIVF